MLATQRKSFEWPAGSLHLLGLLQEGYNGRSNLIPIDIKEKTGIVLQYANRYGDRSDQKWSLEFAGLTPQPILLRMIRRAFNGNSQWLKNIAYKQASKIILMPNDISEMILKTLSKMEDDGSLSKEKITTKTYLERIAGSRRFVSAMNLLLSIQPINIIMRLVMVIYISSILLSNPLFRDINLNQLIIDVSLWVFLVMFVFETLLEAIRFFTRKTIDLKLPSWSLFIIAISCLSIGWGVLRGIELPIKIGNVSIYELLSGIFFDKPYYYLLIPFLYFYTVIWRSGAYENARLGVFTEWYWWPLTPFATAPLYAIGESSRFVRSSFLNRSDIIARIKSSLIHFVSEIKDLVQSISNILTGISILGMLRGFLRLLIFAVLLPILAPFAFVKLLFELMNSLLLLLVFVYLFAMKVFLHIKEFLVDWKTNRAILKKLNHQIRDRKPITGGDFVSDLVRITKVSTMLNYIKLAKSYNKTYLTLDDTNTIRFFASSIERAIYRRENLDTLKVSQLTLSEIDSLQLTYNSKNKRRKMHYSQRYEKIEALDLEITIRMVDFLMSDGRLARSVMSIARNILIRPFIYIDEHKYNFFRGFFGGETRVRRAIRCGIDISNVKHTKMQQSNLINLINTRQKEDEVIVILSEVLQRRNLDDLLDELYILIDAVMYRYGSVTTQ